MATPLEKFTRRLNRIEREVRNLGRTPQLAYSSVEDGTLDFNSGDGTTTIIVGPQPDGTSAPLVVSGPPPPAPAGVAGVPIFNGLVVSWDGHFVADGVAPLDFARVEIHYSSTGPDFLPDLVGSGSTTMAGSWSSVRGGQFAVSDLDPDTDYWFKFITRSLPGKWSDSSDIIGPLRPMRLDASAVDAGSVATAVLQTGILQSGFTLTGRLQLAGTSDSWSPADGLQIGEGIRLYPDGRTNQLEGDFVTDSMTVRDGLAISGNADMLGTMDLSNGITTPTNKMALSQTWPSAITAALGDGSKDESNTYVGLVEYDANRWMIPFNFLGAGIRLLNKSDLSWAGDLSLDASWQKNFYPSGGCKVGTDLFLLGSDSDRAGDWYIYRLISNATVTKVDEYRVGSFSAFGGKRAKLVTIGNNVGMLWTRPTTGALTLRVLTAAFSTGGSDFTLLSGVGNVNVGGAYYGNSDLGSPRLFVSLQQGDSNMVRAFDSNYARKTADEFPRAGGSTLTGLAYDTVQGRLVSMDATTRFWTYSKYAAGGTLNAQYAWYDGDSAVYPAGTVIGGVDVSGTASGPHETAPSPVNSYVMSKRAWPIITAPPAPDELTTDVTQVDKANRIGIYAAIGGTPRWQQYLPVGQRTLPLTDALSTSGAAAGSSGVPSFATASVPSPGRIKSGAMSPTLGSPVIDLNGGGAGNAGPHFWDKDGRPLNHGEYTTTTTTAVATSTFTKRTGWALTNVKSPAQGVTYSNGDFTVAQSGLWLINGIINFGSSSTAHRRVYTINRNGTVIARTESYDSSGGTTSLIEAPVTVVTYLAAGDVISFQGWQNTGGDLGWSALAGTNVCSLTCLAAF